MNRAWKTFVIAVLCAAGCEAARGQVAPATILRFDIDNQTRYIYDTSDLAAYATVPTPVSQVLPTFAKWVTAADIVAVNGKPVKGIYFTHQIALNLATARTPGQGIADGVRNNIVDRTLEIFQTDGTPIGSIMMSGLDGGSAPPGSPSVLRGGNAAITGGTGAFLGARGQFGLGPPIPGATGPRNASVREDPANRRINGGGKNTFILYLIPMSWPQIVVTASGPAVIHASDFTPVTAAKPAKAGEILTLFATGLGPTRPGVDPGQPFTTSPVQIVNSPVDVTVNGAPAQVLYAGGYPGAVDGYQVNFQLPSGITPGSVSLQLTTAFIAGPEVKIPVQ